MVVNSLRGRPAGGSDARERLVSAAGVLFAQQGYASTSARAIAREAGVDHALVNYYFGSKRGLFVEVMALSFNPGSAVEEVLADPTVRDPLRLAEAILARLIAIWEQPGMRDQMLVVVRQAVLDEALRAPLAEFLGSEILARIAQRIGGADATRKASGVSTVIAGVMFARYFVRIEPMASMPPRDVIRTVAPMLAVQLR